MDFGRFSRLPLVKTEIEGGIGGQHSLPGHHGRQGGKSVEIPAQAVAKTFGIVLHKAGGIEDIAADAGDGAIEAHLIADLGGRPLPGGKGRSGRHLVNALADVKMDALHHRGPPRRQRPVGGDAQAKGPVDLRGEVIDAFVPNPGQGIAVDGVIGFHAGRAGIAVLADAEGTDAQLDVRFDGDQAVVQGADKEVDIVPPPVAALGKAAGIGRKTGIILVGDSLVGIEIVIKVNAVEVVAPHHVKDDGEDILPHLGQTGVKIAVVPLVQDPRGMGVHDMVGSQRVGIDAALRPVGIEPGVHLHPAPVRLGEQKGKGIIKGRRCAALGAGEMVGPWLKG
ncbi:MAG: hypothetical protein BWY77_01384 [bacterium ADurb.Bin431]|nr:MAG: hypothetical protein BWY77_01384 [bacterium ADurb.Bin431]